MAHSSALCTSLDRTEEMNTYARFVTSILGLWVAVILGTFLAPGCAMVAPAPPQISMPAPYTDKGLSVTVNSLWKDGNGTVVAITGIATNISAQDFTSCTISLDVLDASGVKVSSADASIDGLKVGQKWRFQALFYESLHC